MAWLARAVVVAVVLSAVPLDALAAPLAALPQSVRVNIAGLGTTYAKIGSTGSIVVTLEDGRVLYSGFGNTITRRGVRRLADPSRAVAAVPDPGETRSRLQQFRDARLAARLDDVQIVTVPFEFSIESDGSNPLAPPLFSAAQITTLHFEAKGGLL